MERAIQDYIDYLHNVRKVSYNTELSYERDIRKAAEYFKEHNIDKPEEITEVNMNSYMLWLECENMSAATVSRRIASLRSFFAFLISNGSAVSDPTRMLKLPKVQRKTPEILSKYDIERLLEQPDSHTVKGIRDRAMLELLCATGIRVSELVGLGIRDVDINRGCIVCHGEKSDRWIRFSDRADKALALYLEHARDILLKGGESTYLFVNCSGAGMSRQGFWKLLKKYAKDADIDRDITPQLLRQTFAVQCLFEGKTVDFSGFTC